MTNGDSPRFLAIGDCPHYAHYDGLDFQPRGFRLNATFTSKLRAWQREQRSRVQACLSVMFQPRMLANDRGTISRSCRHWRQVTQIT